MQSTQSHKAKAPSWSPYKLPFPRGWTAPDAGAAGAPMELAACGH